MNQKNDIGHIYTKEGIKIILSRFKNNNVFITAFLTVCYTGMRTDEVFALTWNDIDFEKRVINIEHNVYSKIKDEKEKWFLGTTKTINGVRKVYICDTLLIALKNYKKKQDYFRKLYGNKYYYYHPEEVKNKYGKIIEYRIVKTIKKSKFLEKFNLVFRIENCRFYDL